MHINIQQLGMHNNGENAALVTTTPKVWRWPEGSQLVAMDLGIALQ